MLRKELLSAITSFVIIFSACKQVSAVERWSSTQAMYDKSLIRISYDLIEICFENEDLNALMVYFSLNYLDDGDDYEDERAELEEIFNNYDNLDIDFILGAITIDGNTATVEENGRFSGDPVAGGARETKVWPGNSYWIKENGQWKFYGNQHRFELVAKSKHHTNGYYLRFALFDTDKYNITSATVEGPDLTGTVNLILTLEPVYRFYWWTTYPAVTGTPTVPATYTFTINTDSGTLIETDVIEQNIGEFAVLSYPESGSTINTAAPTFTWDGISLPGVTYAIEIHNKHGTRIWEKRDITGTSLTYNYDGKASEQLQSGHTYHWMIVAEDNQGDFGGNQSLSDSFTFRTCK